VISNDCKGSCKFNYHTTTTAQVQLRWKVIVLSGRGVLDKTLCDKVCQWLGTGLWISLGTPISATKVVNEIFLKVVDEWGSNSRMRST
jgi:hypothetical protein